LSLDYFDWTNECISFRQFAQRDVLDHLKRLGVIGKKEEDTTIRNEKNLIANRLRLRNIQVDDSMSICPKHRSSFVVDWYDSKSTCHHPDHDPKHRPKATDCRRATLVLSSKIPVFPVGGRLVTLVLRFSSNRNMLHLDSARSTEK